MDRIVKVFYSLKKTLPGIKCAMIGNGIMLKKVREMIHDFNLAKNIELPGFQKEIASYYRSSKTLILMSRSEGMPNCMLEAMASGCVPVVPEVGNITESAFHEENSFVVENPFDIDKFAQYLHYSLHPMN